MAVSVVQAVTDRAENTSQIQLQLTSVAPGNALAVLWSIYQVWDPVPLGVSDDKSGSYVEAAAHARTLAANLYLGSGIHIATNAAGGTTTVTLTLWGGTYVTATLVELAGVDNDDPIDLSAGSDGNSSNPVSGTTGTSTPAGMALAVVSVMPDDDGDANVGIDLPAGYTNIGIEQDAIDNLGHSADGKVISSAAAQSASWGTLDVGARAWVGAIAVLEAAGGGPANVFPPGIAPAGGTGGPAVAAGPVDLSDAGGVAGVAGFGGPVIALEVAQALTGAGAVGASVLPGVPVMVPGVVAVTGAGGVAAGTVFGSPVVVSGAIAVAGAGGVPATIVVGSPELAPGAMAIADAGGVAAATALGAPVIAGAGAAVVAVPGLMVGTAVGIPSISGGAVTAVYSVGGDGADGRLVYLGIFEPPDVRRRSD